MVRKDFLLLTTRTSSLCHGPSAGRGCGTSPPTCVWQPSERNASKKECQSCWLWCWGVREGELLLAVPEPRKSAPHRGSVRCDPKSPLNASPASASPTTHAKEGGVHANPGRKQISDLADPQLLQQPDLCKWFLSWVKPWEVKDEEEAARDAAPP